MPNSFELRGAAASAADQNFYFFFAFFADFFAAFFFAAIRDHLPLATNRAHIDTFTQAMSTLSPSRRRFDTGRRRSARWFDALDDPLAERRRSALVSIAVPHFADERVLDARLRAPDALLEMRAELGGERRIEVLLEELRELLEAVAAVDGVAHVGLGIDRADWIPRSSARSYRRFCKNFRPRWSRLITVPMGIWSIPAISL